MSLITFFGIKIIPKALNARSFQSFEFDITLVKRTQIKPNFFQK